MKTNFYINTVIIYARKKFSPDKDIFSSSQYIWRFQFLRAINSEINNNGEGRMTVAWLQASVSWLCDPIF